MSLCVVGLGGFVNTQKCEYLEVCIPVHVVWGLLFVVCMPRSIACVSVSAEYVPISVVCACQSCVCLCILWLCL